MFNRKILLFITIVCFLSFVSCQDKEQHSKKNETIYTSIYPIQFIVDSLIDDRATVKSIFPPGVDAHTYEPTIKEILNIADGKAFFYLGQHMEGFTKQISTTLSAADVKLIELSHHEHLFTTRSNDNHGHDYGDYDPHIWFDPERMILMTDIIKNELVSIYPKEKIFIEQNYRALVKKFKALDKKFQAELKQKRIPYIIVSHGAYHYWEDKYGIIQVPISGITSTDEPSQKALAHLVNLAENKNINYVLFEKNASNRLASIVQNELGAKPLYIHNLETLVDNDIEHHEDYFSLMEQNLKVLKRATH